MARSTKASNAVQRLKERSANNTYTMVSMADGRFFLSRNQPGQAAETLCEPLEIDAFVHFVNGLDKQTPKKASKLDLAFEQKLKQSVKHSPS
jgi:hypothetical protein